jgi:hypothetical protein
LPKLQVWPQKSPILAQKFTCLGINFFTFGAKSFCQLAISSTMPKLFSMKGKQEWSLVALNTRQGASILKLFAVVIHSLHSKQVRYTRQWWDRQPMTNTLAYFTTELIKDVKVDTTTILIKTYL